MVDALKSTGFHEVADLFAPMSSSVAVQPSSCGT
jgi:hypothetical protein